MEEIDRISSQSVGNQELNEKNPNATQPILCDDADQRAQGAQAHAIQTADRPAPTAADMDDGVGGGEGGESRAAEGV